MNDIKEIIIDSAKRVAVATPIIALALATFILGKLFLGEKLLTKLLVFTFASGVVTAGLLAYSIYEKHKTERLKIKKQYQEEKELKELVHIHRGHLAEKTES